MANSKLISYYQTTCVNMIEEIENIYEILDNSNLQIDKDFSVVAKKYRNIIAVLWNKLIESRENISIVRKLYKAIISMYHLYLSDKKVFEEQRTMYLDTNDEKYNEYESKGLARLRKNEL